MTSFAGVDLDGVKAELLSFVQEAAPRNGSGITTMSYAKCGRPRAIELAERVRPILDALYAEWRAENPVGHSFEFTPEHDACTRLLARIASHEEIANLLGDSATSPQLAASSMHEKVWGAARTQWSTGHRHEAVLAAAKAVNSLLQHKVGRRDLSESKLVRETSPTSRRSTKSLDCASKGSPTNRLGSPFAKERWTSEPAASLRSATPSGIFRTISSSCPNRTRSSGWRRCRSSRGGSTNPRLNSPTISNCGHDGVQDGHVVSPHGRGVELHRWLGL